MHETSIRKGEGENVKRNNGIDIEFEGGTNMRIFKMHTLATDESHHQHNQESRGIKI